MTGQLFAIDQEVTPLDPESIRAGEIFHVAEYKMREGNWYVQLKEIPPRIDPDGYRHIEWYNQISVGPVLPDEQLNNLLCEVAVIYTHGDDPLIVCPPKTEV